MKHDLRVRIGSGLMKLAGFVLVASFGSSCNLDPVHQALSDQALPAYHQLSAHKIRI